MHAKHFTQSAGPVVTHAVAERAHFIIPNMDVVIVITAGDFEGEGYQGFYNLINDYILVAVYS